jgi:two-component system response regulator MtrA
MPKLLLIVDDDPVWCGVLKAFLGRHGYRTVTAHDAPKALAAARTHRPDLIFLDLTLPGMDGLDLLRAIRETVSEVQLPVIVATARADAQAVVQGASLGVRHHFVKSMHSMSELLDAVRQSLEE